MSGHRLTEDERSMFDPIFTPGGSLDQVYVVVEEILSARLEAQP